MPIPSLSLEGKTAIVTGGGTGIGRSIALTFAAAGANVVVCSRTLANLEKVAEEVKALGRRSLAVRTDVTQKTDVDNMVQRVMDEFGAIDILVNDAGVWLGGEVLDFSEEAWDRTMDINIKGCYLCCQAVGKKMVERKRGNIISIASTNSFVSGKEEAPYSASKAGMVMLIRGLAKELVSYNIRVNAVAPGWVRTEMSREIWSQPESEYAKQEMARIPMGRLAEPSDVANAALFLASDLSSYITGATIVVDGGFTA
jgi:NAD(P)-dependent dehydrogenase (short-subunit alcohol dehydrogenase family)